MLLFFSESAGPTIGLTTGASASEGKTVKYIKFGLVVLVFAALVVLAFCENDAKVVSRNVSQAANMFEVNRRIVFYNGINGGYILSIEGRCSIYKDRARDQLEVTCKIESNAYKKHLLGLSDNVTYFAEQLETADVSVYHYRIVFKPQTILPDVDWTQ